MFTPFTEQFTLVDRLLCLLACMWDYFVTTRVCIIHICVFVYLSSVAYKPVTHLQLGLALKRITGRRKVIDLLNRLG